MLSALNAYIIPQLYVVHQVYCFGYSGIHVSNRIEFSRSVMCNKGTYTIRIGTEYRTAAADGFSNSVSKAFKQ